MTAYTADDIRYWWVERAAHLEYDQGMPRADAELEATRRLYAYWSSHSEQMDGWGWDDVQRAIRN